MREREGERGREGGREREKEGGRGREKERERERIFLISYLPGQRRVPS